MKSNLRKKLQAGFTIMEVMIAAAIGTVVLLGVMGVMDYQRKVTQTGKMNSELEEVKKQIQTWINNQTSCNYTFKGFKNGELLPGIKRANTGAASDYVLMTGDRFPGTNWAVTKIELLSGQQVNTDYPTFGAIVDDSGVGTGILRITFEQLDGMTGNTIKTKIGDSFGSLKRILDFPISAVFGTPIYLEVLSCDMIKKDDPAGYCCLNCPLSPADPTTYLSYYGTLVASPAYDPSTNPIYFQSDYDDTITPDKGCDNIGGSPLTLYSGTCYMFNYNLSILNCNAPIQDPLKNM